MVGMLDGTVTLDGSLAVSCQLNIVLPYDLAFYFFVFTKFSEDLYSHKNLHVNIYSISWFIFAEIWKQQRGSSLGECINTLWHTYSMEDDTSLKWSPMVQHYKTKTKLSSIKETWKKLKCIFLSERRQF